MIEPTTFILSVTLRSQLSTWRISFTLTYLPRLHHSQKELHSPCTTFQTDGAPPCTHRACSFSLRISGRFSLVVSCISAPRSLTLVRDPSHLTVPLTEVPLFTSMLLSSAIIPTSDHRSHTCRMHRACQTSHCLSVLMVCCQQELHMRPTTPFTWSNPRC